MPQNVRIFARSGEEGVKSASCRLGSLVSGDSHVGIVDGAKKIEGFGASRSGCATLFVRKLPPLVLQDSRF